MVLMEEGFLQGLKGSLVEIKSKLQTIYGEQSGENQNILKLNIFGYIQNVIPCSNQG